MNTLTGDHERRLATAFVSLADTLVDDYDIIDLLDRLVGHCVALLGADAAGLLLADNRQQLRVVAASSEDAELMELLQVQAQQGPCLDCFAAGEPVSVPDLSATRARWPEFVAAVDQHTAFRSVPALPLRLRGHAIGAMNLFGHQPGPIRESDLALGQALADVATIGILQERAIRRGEVVTEQLQTALTSRVIIEQAKGVLAEHAGVSMNEAFTRLRGFARGRNLRLSEVAGQLVARQLAPEVLSSGVSDGPDTRPR
jgi:transcriptional regulator with GAF, ATPase, and Fis domain